MQLSKPVDKPTGDGQSKMTRRVQKGKGTFVRGAKGREKKRCPVNEWAARCPRLADAA